MQRECSGTFTTLISCSICVSHRSLFTHAVTRSTHHTHTHMHAHAHARTRTRTHTQGQQCDRSAPESQPSSATPRRGPCTHGCTTSTLDTLDTTQAERRIAHGAAQIFPGLFLETRMTRAIDKAGQQSITQKSNVSQCAKDSYLTPLYS